MTPEEILAAAEHVRQIVDKAETDFDVLEWLKTFKPNDCHGFEPPSPGPGIITCPNAPGPCYCTGACMQRKPRHGAIYINQPDAGRSTSGVGWPD